MKYVNFLLLILTLAVGALSASIAKASSGGVAYPSATYNPDRNTHMLSYYFTDWTVSPGIYEIRGQEINGQGEVQQAEKNLSDPMNGGLGLTYLNTGQPVKSIYLPDTQNYLITWSGYDGAKYHVYREYIKASDLTLVGTPTLMFEADGATLGYIEGSSEILIVYKIYDSTLFTYTLKARYFNISTETLGAEFIVSPASSSLINDYSILPNKNSNEYLIAWNKYNYVGGGTIDYDSYFLMLPAGSTAPPATYSQLNTRIGRQASVFDSASSTYKIVGAQNSTYDYFLFSLDHNGNFSSHLNLASSGGSGSGPSLVSDGQNLLMAYTIYEPANYASAHGQKLSLSGSLLGPTTTISGAEPVCGDSYDVVTSLNPQCQNHIAMYTSTDWYVPAELYIKLIGSPCTPNISADQSSLNFGSSSAGSTSITKTVQFTATLAPLSISSAAISGTGSSAFTITNETCTGGVINEFSSCLVTISYANTSAGGFTGTLTVTSNASNSSNLTVALQGTTTATTTTTGTTDTTPSDQTSSSTATTQPTPTNSSITPIEIISPASKSTGIDGKRALLKWKDPNLEGSGSFTYRVKVCTDEALTDCITITDIIKGK